MHIPSEMLNGAVCPVTAVIAATGVGAAGVALLKNKKNAPPAGLFAVVTAAVFGLQMINFPVWQGISGHLLAGVLAAAVIGVPAAVLSMTLVLLVQAFLFGDGGIGMLGANILNMAVIGAGIGGLLRTLFVKRGMRSHFATALAAFVSVELAAGGVALQLAACGKGSLAMAGTLLGIHAGIALAEGMASGLMAFGWERVRADRALRTAYVAAGVSAVACLALAQFASAFPDGFEWTMERFGLMAGADGFAAPFADYAVRGFGGIASAMSAGAIGMLAVALCAFALLRPLAAGKRD